VESFDLFLLFSILSQNSTVMLLLNNIVTDVNSHSVVQEFISFIHKLFA